MHFRRRDAKDDGGRNHLAPLLERTESGRAVKIERFSHYLGTNYSQNIPIKNKNTHTHTNMYVCMYIIVFGWIYLLTARQMGFEDESECPQLIKLAYGYLKRSKGVDEKIYEYFAKHPNAEDLYVNLVEEFERCILGYLAFHWSQAPLLITQVCFFFL